MQDIAEHVGVSRQLVSLVLRGDPGPSSASREKILAAADDLGYRVNSSGRMLRQSRTMLLGAVFEMRNPFQVGVVERLFVRAREAGYGLALGPRTADRSTDDAVGSLLEDRVDAIVAFNPETGSRALEDARAHVPVVWMGEWSTAEGIDNIHADEAGGLREAVEHLTGLGHRNIAYVGGLDGVLGPDRAQAYRDAMAAAGLADRADVVASGFDEDAGAQAAREILAREHRPTALVCCGDQCATGVLAVLALAGVEVPAQMSVVGFDDSRLSSLSYHQLTSVHQDVEATVEAALASVLDRIAGDRGPRRVISTPTSLVVRRSTGPVPDGS